MGEPDSIRITARLANQQRILLLLGQQTVSLLKTDMTALAAKYPAVAADLTQARLTANQEEAYRAAIIRIGVSRMAGSAETGAIAETSVLGRNLAFRNAHDQEFGTLAKTGIWITP